MSLLAWGSAWKTDAWRAGAWVVSGATVVSDYLIWARRRRAR